MTQTIPRKISYAKIIRLMLMGTAATYFLAALLFNEIFIGLLFENFSVEQVRLSEVIFLLLGTLFAIAFSTTQRSQAIHRAIDQVRVANLVLAATALAFWLSIFELSLRPFAQLGEKTSIFQRDDLLGWKLRPGANDEWNGTRVQINNKGLRGPEVDYTKPNNVKRILYLGDSVTFGFLIESATQTFPYLAEPQLEKALHCKVETVNMAVGGYSPWQQLEQLRSEGLKYQPDLVIVGFVLNDITEKIQLARFGGTSEGFQLEHSTQSWLSRWSDRVALLHFGNRLITPPAIWRSGPKAGSGNRTG